MSNKKSFADFACGKVFAVFSMRRKRRKNSGKSRRRKWEN